MKTRDGKVLMEQESNDENATNGNSTTAQHFARQFFAKDGHVGQMDQMDLFDACKVAPQCAQIK